MAMSSDAQAMFKEVQRISKLPPKQQEKQLKKLPVEVQLGFHMQMANDPKAAEHVLDEEIKRIQETAGPDHPQLLKWLQMKLMFTKTQDRHKDACDVAILAYDITKNAFGEDDLRYTVAANNKALAMCPLEMYDEAEVLFKDALARREAHHKTAHSDVAQSLHNLALLYKNTKRMDEAKPLYIRAIDMWREVIKGAPAGMEGPMKVNLAISLSDIGSVHIATADKLAARESLDEARALFEAQTPPGLKEGAQWQPLKEVLDKLKELES